ncbi:hypothetical protein H4Q26_009204 [Puccinia striiformis f. sp. tritici PST-130]|nr:hypothetical protein H4Q26_009204 [Puccinia striiformis f. sp. tritici PST-130]
MRCKKRNTRRFIEYMPTRSFSRSKPVTFVQEQPGPRLDFILQTQSAFEVGLDHIKSGFYTLCPEGVDIQSSKTSDQHDEEVKILRLSGLDKLLRDMFKELRSVFTASSGLICQLGLSMVRCDHLEKLIDTWDRLVGDISRSDHAIHRTIVWLEGSELEFVPQNWPINLDQINVILIDITKRANPAINKEKNDQLSDADLVTETNPPSELALQMAQSLISVIKLSRLFFRKSYDWARNTKMPLFTKMSSDQLESIGMSARYTASHLSEIQGLLMSDPNLEDFFSVRNFTIIVKMIKMDLETAMLLTVLYFIPCYKY